MYGKSCAPFKFCVLILSNRELCYVYLCSCYFSVAFNICLNIWNNCWHTSLAARKKIGILLRWKWSCTKSGLLSLYLRYNSCAECLCSSAKHGVFVNVIKQLWTLCQVVENPLLSNQVDGAQSAYQYFENVRNFLVAVEEMGLPSFEASDLEQVSSSWWGLVPQSMLDSSWCSPQDGNWFYWRGLRN